MGSYKYMLFCVWLLLIILVVRSLLTAPRNISSFIFILVECSIICITHTVFICSIVDGHLSFQFGLLWILLWWTLCTYPLVGTQLYPFLLGIFLGVEVLGNHFISYCPSDFQNDCTISPSPQQYMRVSSPIFGFASLINSCEHVFSVISLGINMYPPNNWWGWTLFHIFMGHLDILFCEVPAQIFSVFKNSVVFLILLICGSALQILDMGPLLNTHITNIFPRSVIFLLIVCFDEYKFWIVM